MEMESDDFYQSIIVDHDRHPRNYGQLEDATHSADGYNPLCGDHQTVFVRMVDGQIQQVTFTGRGCAISRASASIMTTLVDGLSPAHAEEMVHAVELFLTSGDTTTLARPSDLVSLKGVHRFPTRRTCAMLAWNALRRALREGKAASEDQVVE